MEDHIGTLHPPVEMSTKGALLCEVGSTGEKVAASYLTAT